MCIRDSLAQHVPQVDVVVLVGDRGVVGELHPAAQEIGVEPGELEEDLQAEELLLGVQGAVGIPQRLVFREVFHDPRRGGDGRDELFRDGKHDVQDRGGGPLFDRNI